MVKTLALSDVWSSGSNPRTGGEVTCDNCYLTNKRKKKSEKKTEKNYKIQGGKISIHQKRSNPLVGRDR